MHNILLQPCKKPKEISLGFLKPVYSGLGASTGQTFAHAPQSIQASLSITYISSPGDIHDTGHSGSQAPQLIHSSLIKYATYITPPNVNHKYFIIIFHYF